MQYSEHREQKKRARLAAFCVLLSLLLHAAGAWLLQQLPEPPPPARPKRTATGRVLQIHRLPKTAPSPPKEHTQPPPVVKTSPDRPDEHPEQTDFRGSRNTRAEGEADAPRKESESPYPSMMGEEKEELNTVEQERQDGSLEHDGRKHPMPATPPEPPPPPGVPQQPPSPQPEQGQDSTTTRTEASPAAHPRATQKDGALKLQNTPQAENAPTPPHLAAPASGTPDSIAPTPAPPRPKIRRRMYDPSLAEHAQPGFRTTERRSRSSGRFVLGRAPALNVSATPMGHYEMQVYRLIAARWYAACDEHRGDIIPGRIIIAFRLNKRGNVETMNLVTRRGAGVIQQGFTFRAIRSALLPPMPANVQRELIGEQLELIFTFNFD